MITICKYNTCVCIKSYILVLKLLLFNFRNNSVAPIDQLLTALRFYASAGHLATVADFTGMDISTASRIIAKVTLAIARLYPQFVKMPTQEIKAQSDFYNIASFPRVIGCVDGTHVRIQSPGKCINTFIQF